MDGPSESANADGPVTAAPIVPAQPGPTPEPLVPSTPPPAVRPRQNSNVTKVLAIVIAVVSVLCVSGLGIAYHLYDRATAPNRSAPDVVVDNYLQAVLVDRNETTAAEFACSNTAQLAPFIAFRDEVEAKETQIGAGISFMWHEGSVSKDGTKSATIPVMLIESVSINGVVQTVPSNWTFTAVQSGDWRVCGASSAD